MVFRDLQTRFRDAVSEEVWRDAEASGMAEDAAVVL
jgi:hypothetical protein